MNRLDLGGGLVPAPGHINIDLIDSADIVWDLNNGLPKATDPSKDENPVYPFETPIEGVRCHQVLEHLETIIPLMNDIYEVMEEGADFEISTPYALSEQCWTDPTHKRGYTLDTFLYFCKDSPFQKEKGEYGITANFQKIKAEIIDGWNLEIVLRK